MKTRPLILRKLGLALALATSAAAWGQNPPPPAPPVQALEPIEARKVRQPPEPPGEPERPTSAEAVPWQGELRRAQAEAARAMRDVERQIAGMRFGYSGPEARRLLVIPGTSATDEALTQSRDDLAVMTTILNRAAHPEKGRRPDLVIGFNDWHLGGGRDLDALLIDGFGAVFLLGVDYPLVASAAEEEKPAEPKNTRDNTWEKTRREVLGQPDLEDDREAEEGPGRTERVFDATRVNELEQRLKESLRHAGNLRGLTAEDWILVQVTGPQSRPAPGLRSGSKSERSQVAHPNRRSGGGSSVLTLRVRKSAVDRVAAEPSQLEEFIREVKVSRRLENAPRTGQ